MKRIRTHRYFPTFLATAAILAVGILAWAGLFFMTQDNFAITQQVASTKREGIERVTRTEENNRFYFQTEYAQTGSEKINRDIRKHANTLQQQCIDSLPDDRSDEPQTCNTTFAVATADDDYLGFLYKTQQNNTPVHTATLLYSIDKEERVQLGDFIKKKNKAAEALSALIRAALEDKYADTYQHNQAFAKRMMSNTEPRLASFERFLLLDGEETFRFYFDPRKVAPQKDGIAFVDIPARPLYDFLKPKVRKNTFPKLTAKIKEEKRQKEKEEREKRALEQQRKQQTQHLAANRSSIDCAQMKCIALTYDDGPGSYTPELLDILDERHAVATFFVLGQSAHAHGNMLKRAVNKNNEIANHTWNHADLLTLGDGDVAWQIQQTSKAIFDAIGTYPKLMRPPYGSYDGRVAALTPLPIAMWSIDTNDWQARNSDTIYQTVVAQAHPGAVVLMHDIHPESVHATPAIIDTLQSQGYVFVTMSELFGIEAGNLPELAGQVLQGR